MAHAFLTNVQLREKEVEKHLLVNLKKKGTQTVPKAIANYPAQQQDL